jgi:hypothetical protein
LYIQYINGPRMSIENLGHDTTCPTLTVIHPKGE